jgi:glycosyltransferase involved in cell wall biosynthesis
MMKIAFDLRRIRNPGIGRYMKCLTEAVIADAPEHEYLLILPPGDEALIQTQQAGVEKISPSLKYYSLREQVELPRILRRHKADLLHSPHFLLPLIRPCPAVATIHDVIYLACREDLPSRGGRLYYRAMMGAAVKLADRIVTDSEFSKADIVRHLHANPEKVTVVHCGIDASFRPVTDPAARDRVLSRYGIRDEYVLYTGIFKPRKNHAGLLRAFREFLASGNKETQLVIAGPMGEGEAELRRLAVELGIADKVAFLGFVAEADLPALYSGARVYACPSLYEGFGFTVLEAMACGTPVVCSPETSLPEVAGDAALYANARSPVEFASALSRLFNDEHLRAGMVEKGFRNCERFRWQKAARATMAVYQTAVVSGETKPVCA